ncbi:MAG: hypothetical protein L0Z62_39320 [Gemmataceae bacterium]|nr:hypothetical protein [Gemmataceae bacterium]
MSPNGHHELEQLVASVRSLRCWYVSCGGAAGPTFQLALGDKLPRRTPLKNLAHPEEYRRFEGEMNLLVWCSWRLDAPDRPLTSSDDSPEGVARELGNLVGASVEAVSLTAPAWDLVLSFSGGRLLRIFCDHVPGDPSFDGNWELWGRDHAALVGPGAHYTVQPRAEAEALG